MHLSFQPTSWLSAIWTCEDNAVSHLSQWISMRVGHSRGTNMAYKKDLQDAFLNWPQYRWFHLMKVNRARKMAVLKLQYSDKGGVMTKIMGNQTGDHTIQVFKLNRNVMSICECLPEAMVQMVVAWKSSVFFTTFHGYNSAKLTVISFEEIPLTISRKIGNVS